MCKSHTPFILIIVRFTVQTRNIREMDEMIDALAFVVWETTLLAKRSDMICWK